MHIKSILYLTFLLLFYHMQTWRTEILCFSWKKTKNEVCKEVYLYNRLTTQRCIAKNSKAAQNRLQWESLSVKMISNERQTTENRKPKESSQDLCCFTLIEWRQILLQKLHAHTYKHTHTTYSHTETVTKWEKCEEKFIFVTKEGERKSIFVLNDGLCTFPTFYPQKSKF